VRVFAGVPYRQGPPNDSGVLENGDAQTFLLKFPTLKPTLLQAYSNTQSSPAFQWSQNAVASCHWGTWGTCPPRLWLIRRVREKGPQFSLHNFTKYRHSSPNFGKNYPEDSFY